MWRADTVVVGGGQAGLAMSRCLTEAGVDHVVLERGRVAQRWRDERRRSLRLLTPNWMSRLPGARYRGPDPDGFMTVPALVSFLQRYAEAIAAPVVHDTPVRTVRRTAGGYRVLTPDREIACRAVVVATGACQRPRVPAVAAGLHPAVASLTPDGYRDPAALPGGGVLVVGASATGVQLAAELRADGRDVVLAVGRHTRLPRTHRGRDIHAWLDRLGVLRRPLRDGAGRTEPSAQLLGSPERREVDLATLQRAGIRLAGRLTGLDGTRAQFADDWATTCPPPTTGWPGCSPASTPWSTATTPGRLTRSGRRRPRVRRASWTWPPAGSRPWCGRPATGGPTRGCRSRCSTRRARSCTAAG